MNETFDWRADDKRRAVEAARRNLDGIDARIVELERDLRIANAAWGEYQADRAEITRQQFALRDRAPVQIRNSDGFEAWGVDPDAQREYDRLAEAIKAREAEYERWVNERTEHYMDGPIRQSWSPRNPISVERRLQRLRVVRPMAENELRELEAQLTPGQLLELGGQPAPDLVEHEARVAAGRQRAWIGS